MNLGRKDAGSAALTRDGTRCGFSLVEIVVAIGIVGTAMVAALGFAETLSTLAIRNRSASRALEAGDAMLEFIGHLDFDRVAELLVSPEELKEELRGVASGPQNRRRILYATVDRATFADDPLWAGESPIAEFEGTLVRDRRLSPESGDAGAAWLAFSLRIRWPVRSESSQAAGGGVIAIAGSVRR